jgi:hypothetical protein
MFEGAQDSFWRARERDLWKAPVLGQRPPSVVRKRKRSAVTLTLEIGPGCFNVLTNQILEGADTHAQPLHLVTVEANKVAIKGGKRRMVETQKRLAGGPSAGPAAKVTMLEGYSTDRSVVTAIQQAMGRPADMMVGEVLGVPATVENHNRIVHQAMKGNYPSLTSSQTSASHSMR